MSDEGLFAVRVSGASMDGGSAPLRDGDWAVMSLARGAPASALENRVVLLQVPGQASGAQYQIKRLRRRDGKWVLTSDNPDGPVFEGQEDMTPIARLERTITPESLAPAPGTVIVEDDLPGSFGIDTLPARTGRFRGHLFILVDRRGLLDEPDRLRYPIEDRRPGETAFVLARGEDRRLIYLGVGRWLEDDGRWAISPADFVTWRTWGAGRETSRRLPDGALARAQLVVDALVALPEERRSIRRANGHRARVLGTAARGGLRIDGGDGGFKERTVSLSDLAWVVVADEDARASAGVLDEARVNRLRYLEGTPKGSTRWIDTGWAIAAWNEGKSLARQPSAGSGALRRIHEDDGSAIDATFRVEPMGDLLSVLFESRGGAKGKKGERNTDYDRGLELLLARLGRSNLRVADALVETRITAALAAELRRLRLDGRPYPLVIDDAGEIRRAISSAQARVGRSPDARGSGNRTKRLRLVIDGSTAMSADALARVLERK